MLRVAQSCESRTGSFTPRHHIGTIAEQRKSQRDNFQKFRSILKPRAINEAAGRCGTRKGVQRLNERVGGKPLAEPTFDEAVRAAKPARIQIVEKVRSERGKPGSPRAALAKARPDDAAINIAAPASGDLTRETEGITKIEADRLGGRRHALKQS